MNIFEILFKILIILIIIILIIGIVFGSLLFNRSKTCLQILENIFGCKNQQAQCFISKITPSLSKKICKIKNSSDFENLLLEITNQEYQSIENAVEACQMKKFWT